MRKRRIILVDEEPYLTTILASKLRALGDEIITADDAEAALVFAIAQPPELIVCGTQTAAMSGYELSVRLKQHPRTEAVPVLLVAVNGYRLSAKQLEPTNIRALLHKPFNARELQNKIDEMIGPARIAAAPTASF